MYIEIEDKQVVTSKNLFSFYKKKKREGKEEKQRGRVDRTMINPIAMNTYNMQVVVSKEYYFLSRNTSSWEKHLLSSFGQELHKVSLEYLVRTEKKGAVEEPNLKRLLPAKVEQPEY